MFKWSNFSGSLLVRSVYLITLPIVLVQVVGIIIFFELHWDLVLKRSAKSISNEIKILEINKTSESIDEYANILEIIKINKFEIEKAENIDKIRAEASLKRAKDRLKSNDGIDSKRAELSLARAMNRLSISTK